MSDRLEYDVLLVGASPSNLALAHHLVDLAKDSGTALTLAILEKAPEIGNHVLSGAVSNPRVLKKLFPNYVADGGPMEGECAWSAFAVLGDRGKWDVPRLLVPPGMVKEGYWILTLSHVVKWMADQLLEKAAALENVEVELLPGFAAHAVVFEGEGDTERVAGVQVVKEATGSPDEENIYGKVTCFGDKGFISRDIVEKYSLRDNPQIWSVGVKEVWELTEDKGLNGKVWHTMGYPMVDGSFGGGFVYGMKDNRLTIGMVISLDSPNPNLNPQQLLQEYKKHPWIQDLIKGGKLFKYGAAVLPEGGYYSLPKKFAVNSAMLLGDALGVLDISNLSGIDKSMECGYQAAEILHEALQKGDFSEAALSGYKDLVMSGFVGKELRQGRYFRKAWQENPRLLSDYLPVVMDGIDAGNPIGGMISVGLKNNPIQAATDALRLKTLMDGNKDIGPVTYQRDHEHIVSDFAPPRTPGISSFEKDTVYSRPDAVFYAYPNYHEGNEHIDEFNANTCVACITRYDKLGKDVPCVSDCTAEVHRVDVVSDLRKHGMSLENCIQCRTCEIVCPEVNLRVRAAEQGSGPDFMGL
ncbi:MAG: 4Fe-4S dicluster domain-containing protein [Vampirovibrio sp.]|nr:4Fe-4S dicluster domain-containing protein [Vampirovibrio sp.]